MDGNDNLSFKRELFYMNENTRNHVSFISHSSRWQKEKLLQKVVVGLTGLELLIGIHVRSLYL